MTCRCCRAETSVTFAQHLLHTYLRRFHDLYVCRSCITYRRESVCVSILRIVYFLCGLMAVQFIAAQIHMSRFALLLGVKNTVVGTLQIFAMILFEYCVYIFTNRNRKPFIKRMRELVTVPYEDEWQRPGFVKSLIHNYLGRFDYLFVDVRNNMYYRENHIVSCVRISWLLLYNYVTLLGFFLMITCSQYRLLIGWLFVVGQHICPLLAEYIAYRIVPMKPQRLTETIHTSPSIQTNEL